MKKLLFGMAALVLVTTTYAEGLEIKGGYDVWRNISKDYAGDSGGSIDRGWTLGAEYLWSYGQDYAYGLGTEFRSMIKDDNHEYNESMPVYLVGKYDMLDDMFYVVGRGGYNASSNINGKNTKKGGPCATNETDGRTEWIKGEILFSATRGSEIDCEQGRQSFSL